jgi:hypothetical protein
VRADEVSSQDELKYSAHAIETALTLRLLFQLPFRQAEGFL